MNHPIHLTLCVQVGYTILEDANFPRTATTAIENRDTSKMSNRYQSSTGEAALMRNTLLLLELL